MYIGSASGRFKKKKIHPFSRVHDRIVPGTCHAHPSLAKSGENNSLFWNGDKWGCLCSRDKTFMTYDHGFEDACFPSCRDKVVLLFLPVLCRPTGNACRGVVFHLEWTSVPVKIMLTNVGNQAICSRK